VPIRDRRDACSTGERHRDAPVEHARRANGIATHRSSMPGGFNDNAAFVNFYNG
jgi:hypothetical protein